MTLDQFIACRIREEDALEVSRNANPRRRGQLVGLRNSMPGWLRQSKLQDLDVQHCQAYREHLLTTGSRASGSPRNERSANTRFREFQRLLDEAKKRDHITINPAREVEIPKPLEKRRSGAISPNDIFFEAELRTVLHQLHTNHDRPDLYVCFSLMALTGLTAAEALVLRRRDIVLEFLGKEGPRPLIWVRHAQCSGKVRKLQQGRRKVEASPSLVRLLSQWLDRISRKPSAWLFPCSTSPNECLPYTDVVRAWKYAVRILPSSRQLPLGAIRDTYAAFLIDHREDVVHVGLHLGYKSVRPVEKRYKHWITRYSRGKMLGLHQKIGICGLGRLTSPTAPEAA